MRFVNSDALKELMEALHKAHKSQSSSGGMKLCSRTVDDRELERAALTALFMLSDTRFPVVPEGTNFSHDSGKTWWPPLKDMEEAHV